MTALASDRNTNPQSRVITTNICIDSLVVALIGTKNLVAVSALADDDRYSHISDKVKDLQNRRLVTASDSKSPTNQMGVSLNKTLAAAPDAEQIQTKIFEGKKSDNFGKINSKKTLILDLLENTPDTKKASVNADLYNQNQSFTNQTQFFTSTKELAIRKKLLKNWAATIRSDIVERTLESKLSSDVRISLKISRTGEILSIETIGKSVTNESIKNFIDVIRMSGKFPMAPQGLKLDYVTFPVNFRSRG
ncbi:hypothetical protein OAW66_05810 [Alphaproteobacteria bacterium]|nr:hypothetical protein [Alphaproteobacteria bacterium]